MSTASRYSSLTPCRSPTPEPPIMQPDHFYGSEGIQFPPSPKSDGKTWLDPSDDPTASRGIPVFKPTMEQFEDFEAFMEKINCWGQRSGIVKVIPPKEWTESLPSIKPQLKEVKIKTPIEQHMLGSGGLFRQQNMEKRKVMSVREWVELCNKEEYRAPAVHEVGLESRNLHQRVVQPRVRRGKKKEAGIPESDLLIKDEPEDESVLSPPGSEGATSPPAEEQPASSSSRKQSKSVAKPPPRRRVAQSREVRQANLAERAARDSEFLETFDSENDWLPHNTLASDYTPEFCLKLERHYWRNCGLGKSAWYGADTQGTLYTDETKIWNVGHLPSALDRLLPASNKGLPGVNTPYLYFGMWRATFAWHVEDMDLYSINYIHFGAPKFWYAVPQAKASALEHAMRTYFPKDTSQCHQFLRHKSFLVSPTTLAKSSCRPNHLVQHAGEFVITYPRGYHAGFNLGLNCAESVNFALECWIELGRVAKACKCVSDSVRIDVDQLLQDRAEEARVAQEALEVYEGPPPKPKRSHKKKVPTVSQVAVSPMKQEKADDRVIPPLKIPRKRKIEEQEEQQPKLKKIRLKPPPKKQSNTVTLHPSASSSTSAPTSTPASALTLTTKPTLPKISVTLKLGPRPADAEPYPCCLCVSMSKNGLLPVHDPPLKRWDAVDAANNPEVWMAHELCASIIPETWVDDFEGAIGSKERMVFGVDAIVKDRWNLKCSACSRSRPKAHGAPVQCTKGKCPKAFHVTCAQDVQAHGTLFTVVKEVEKEVVLLEPSPPPPASVHQALTQSGAGEAMQVDPNSVNLSPNAEERVFKVIKKLEVQILCSQHNPAIAAQKRAAKQEKIKQDLLTLPVMSRIKIRVSSGVFEVSLLRVIEESSSIEVLWDRGVKREFKWGSVVFGSTDGPVLQKPSDATVTNPPGISQPHGQLGPQHSVSVAEASTSSVPVQIYPSVTAATAAELSNKLHPPGMTPPGIPSSSANPPANSNPTATANTTVHPAFYAHTTQHRVAPYEYWPYPTLQPPPPHQQQQVSYAAAAAVYPQTATYTYPYSGGYYSGATAYPMNGQAGGYAVYPYAQGFPPSTSTQYRNGGLQWQRPYQGPGSSTAGPTSASTTINHATGAATPVSFQAKPPPAATPAGAEARHISRPPSPAQSRTLSSESAFIMPSASGDSDTKMASSGSNTPVQTREGAMMQQDGGETSVVQGDVAHASAIVSALEGVASSSSASSFASPSNGATTPSNALDLSSLAKLSAVELTELLTRNPQLRDEVFSVLNQSAI